MYAEYAEENEMHKAQILVGTLGAALAGKKIPAAPKLIVSAADEKPDRAAFYADPQIRKRIRRPQ